MRQLTYFLGIILITISLFRLTGLFEPNSLWLFSFSVSACLFAAVDLISETQNKWWMQKIKILDKIALLVFILPFVCAKINIDFDKLLKTPTDFVTLLAFGFVITTIGKKDLNYLEKTVSEMKAKYFIEKRKNLPTMDSDIAKNAIKDLANAEYNTFLQINKIIIELHRCDHIANHQQRIHDGWGLLHDTLSYYAILQVPPFYDYKLNDLFNSFYSEVGNGSENFITVSDPDNVKELAKMNFLGTEQQITAYRVLHNHGGTNQGHQHIRNALQHWKDLKMLVSERYEDKGFKDELKEEIGTHSDEA
ncbi:hypothetical protein COO04_09980 [Bacillus toyonensis]|uniref:hypothetical protein n=1 Tax=Bacillus cereus group TaxID=86661 RepID=UPI000BEE47C6|nr:MULTISPECIES: hypothetical protein [Bacillus cereus group]MBJ7931858.1 hypothetical protein [Bacillus cereus group sp. N31]PEG16364.1 hypothetical protein COO04_09980 [Bacillus toyonensis]